MVKTMKLTEQQQKRVEQNQRIIQHLNTESHFPCEIRQLLSEITGETIDPSNEIRLPFYSDAGFNIHFGKNVFVNSGVMFTDLGGITLEDGVLIGPGASLITVNHPLNPAERHGLELASVHIKQNAWVGAQAIILPGVTVGENAVVAAGAVVTKNVPANTVVAGTPARVIRELGQKK